MSDDSKVQFTLEATDQASAVVDGIRRSVERLARELKSFATVKIAGLSGTSTKSATTTAADYGFDRSAVRRLRERMTLQGRLTRQRLNDEAQVARDEARRLREHARSARYLFGLRLQHEREIARERNSLRESALDWGRSAARSGRDAADRIHRGSTRAAAATGLVAGAGARRIVRTEAGVDAAEVDAQTYAWLSKQAARQLRNAWAAPLAEALGSTTERMLSGYTEAIKVGIPVEGAKSFSGLAVQVSEAWGTDVKDVTDTLGIVNQILTSSGDAFSFDKIKSVANTVQHLAAKMSTTPEKMIEFMKRGAGAAQVLGMSQEAGLAFGGASTSLGNRPRSSGELFDYIASRVIEMPKLVQQQGIEGRNAREMIRSLGYASARQMDAERRAHPDAFLPELFERFNNIKDAKKKDEAIRFFAGREWFGEFGRIVTGAETYKEAQKLQQEAKGFDAIGKAWDQHRTKLVFVGRQIRAGFLNVLGEFGQVITPLARQIGDYFLSWSDKLRGGGIQQRFRAAIDGLVEGFGFNSVPQMLEGVFGKPGEGNAGSIQAWKESFRGFAAGLKDIGDGIKAFFSALAGANAGPEELGRWAGRFIGLGATLIALSPAITILGGITSALAALGATVVSVWATLRLAGLAGGAGAAGSAAGGLLSAGAMATAGGIIGTAFLATIANRLGILKPPDMSKGVGRGILEFLDPGLADRLLGNRWQDPPKRSDQGDDLNGSSGSDELKGSAGSDDLRKRITSGALQNTVESLNRLGGLIQSAALGGGGLGSLGGIGGSGLGLGGGLGSLGGSGALLGNSTPGSRLGDVGIGRRGILGGLGGGITSPMLRGEAETNARKAYDFFRSKGLSHEAASGILASMKQESGFNPNARGDGGKAHGLFQHHPDRRAAILRGTGINMSTASFDKQLDGAWWEMNHGDRGAQRALQILRTPGISARDAGAAFVKHFERPLRDERASRGALAEGFAARFGSGGTGSTGGVGDTAGLRLKSAETVAGGASARGLTDMARAIQTGGLPGGFNRFTALNDAFHLGRRSKHNQGLAGDVTIMDPRQSGVAAEAIRQKFRDAGLKDSMFRVIDEYKNPSGNATGGHLHFQFNTPEAAKMYEDYTARSRALANSARPAVDPDRIQRDPSPEAMTRDVPVNPMKTFDPKTLTRTPGTGGGGGTPIIQINGHNSDPETLANAVQKRLNEQYERRTTDIEHNWG